MGLVQATVQMELPRWLSTKESTCQFRRRGFGPWVGKFTRRRKWQPTPVFLPGESHGQRSLVRYSPWGRRESDMNERLNSNSCSDEWSFFRDRAGPGAVASLCSDKLTQSPFFKRSKQTSETVEVVLELESLICSLSSHFEAPV